MDFFEKNNLLESPMLVIRPNKKWDKCRLKYSFIVKIIKLLQIYLMNRWFSENWLGLTTVLTVRSYRRLSLFLEEK